ncbi:MAG: protein-disulfide reductase DsbD family protein [Nitratireductor sp.]
MADARKPRSFKPVAAVSFLAAVSAFVVLFAGAATAASSQWQDIGGGKVRLVALKDPAEGTLSGIVEVRLDKGWKTYWRSPGSSGIPPEFDFSGSRSIEVDRVHFPSPMHIEAGGSVFYGYKDTVAFPFYGLAGTGETQLRLDLLIGVCEEICIPATASLTISDDDLNVSDPKAQMQIMFAETLLPQAPPDDLRATGLKQTGNRLELEIRAEEAGSRLSAVIWPRDGGWVSDPATAEPQENGSYLSVFELPQGVKVPDIESGGWSFALLLQDPDSHAVRKAVEGRIGTPAE